MRKNDRQLIHFYKQVALMIIKSKDRCVSLSQLESRFPRWRDAIFSWMQWTDAKMWFHLNNRFGCGTTYYLRPEYADMTPAQMVAEMNKHYGLYQD